MPRSSKSATTGAISTSPAFLARVHPEVAVIEVGKDNPYGHPHQQTLQKLADAGVTVYRTDRDGTVLVRSDGTSYAVTTETSAPGLWNRTTPAAQTTAATAAVTGTIPPLPAITINATDLVQALPSNIPSITIPVTLPPLQIGNASSIYISATQFNAPGDDRENLNGEWVRISNRGDDAVLIAGWMLSDRRVAPLCVPPGNPPALDIGDRFHRRGTLNDTSLYMGQSPPVWGNSGDVAILRTDGQDHRREVGGGPS